MVMDIFYDYFLGKNWENFSKDNQRTYTDNIYSILLKHLPGVPEKAKITFQRMVDDDFCTVVKPMKGWKELFKGFYEELLFRLICIMRWLTSYNWKTK